MKRGCLEVSDGCRSERLVLIGVAAGLWVILVCYRLFSLQISDVGQWLDWARKQHLTQVQVASERGPIVDRNGKSLAVSVPAGSIYAHPHLVKDTKAAAKVIAPIVGESEAEVLKLLNSKKPFVWLARQLPRFNSQKVTELKLTGIGTLLEAKRFYPYNQAASAVIGKVGVDGSGLSGIEKLHEARLHEGSVTTKASRDAFGNLILKTSLSEPNTDSLVPSKGQTGKYFTNPPRGDEVELTIDADLQVIVDNELSEGMLKAKAKQAMAVLMDSKTGEIYALSQAPAFNFNLHNNSKNAARELKSLLVEAVYEPGSILKPLVAAAAIEEKVIRPSDLINCENGRYPYGKHVIKDVHPSATISLHDVVVRSSNIGMTKVGERLGANRLYNYLRLLGFGTPTQLGLIGESRGILRSVESWAKVDLATHSFGQGIAVTPLQIVRATAALANGGVLLPLLLVNGQERYQPVPESRRIFSEKTTAAVRQMMIDVVESEHGTGSNAKVPGVVVGGKTGTAQKAAQNGRGYQAGAYVASFVGFFEVPGSDSSMTLLVAIDEPRSGVIYGGALAAPVFKKITERVIELINTRQKLSRPMFSDSSEAGALQQVSYSVKR